MTQKQMPQSRPQLGKPVLLIWIWLGLSENFISVFGSFTPLDYRIVIAA
jgi:hypothetical protein